MTRHFGLSRQIEPRAINPEAPCDVPFEGWPNFDPNPLLVRSETVMGWAHWIRTVVGIVVSFLVATAFIILVYEFAFARDDGGRFANSPLKAWFDGLESGKGLCCSFADGLSIKDVDWSTSKSGNNIHYTVYLEGKWIDVPPTAVVTVPNQYGPAVVWPIKEIDGTIQIRCFMPGSMS